MNDATNPTTNRPGDREWRAFVSAAREFAEHLDQFEKVKFDTTYGTVYVSIARVDPYPDNFFDITIPEPPKAALPTDNPITAVAIWRPINEPPPFDQHVLLRRADGTILSGFRTTRGYVTRHNQYTFDAEWWMLCPPPPYQEPPP